MNRQQKILSFAKNIIQLKLNRLLFDKRNRNSDEPLSIEESRELKKVAGQVSWVASQTRSDLSFDGLELNIMKNKLTVEQVSRANKAIRMLKRSKTD